MTKPVRKAQFQDVIIDLWNKVKEHFVSDITFVKTIDTTMNKTNNTLKKIKNGQEEVIIEHIINEWDDLEYVSRFSSPNVFDKNTQVTENKVYGAVGNGNHGMMTDDKWRVAHILCTSDDEFTIIKDGHDSSYCAVYTSGQIRVAHIPATPVTIGGKKVYKVTVPTLPTTDVHYLVVNMHKNLVPPETMMIFNDNIPNDELPTEYIPYSTHGNTFIDGSQVVTTFDSSNTKLTSNTLGDAIRELDATTQKLVKSLSYSGATDMILTVHKADGTTSEIDLTGGTVAPIATRGQIQTYAYDISQTNPITRTTDNDENQLIQGDKAEINGQEWVKCDGQTYQLNGQTVILPTSSQGQYMFMCLG